MDQLAAQWMLEAMIGRCTTADNLVLKLLVASQLPEKKYADAFPMLVAKIYWQEQVSIRLFTATGYASRTLSTQPARRKQSWLQTAPSKGRVSPTGCVLLYLSSCGVTIRDCGGLNLAVSSNTALEALPRLLFIDCLSWTEDATVSCNWSGYFGLIRTYMSSRRPLVVVAGRRQTPDQCFNTLAMECQHTGTPSRGRSHG